MNAIPGDGGNDPVCLFRRHQHLAREGETLRYIYRLEDGWACRYRLLRDGRRQITGLFLPGEYCEPQWVLGNRASNPVVALTWLRARGMPIDSFEGGSFGIASRALCDALLRSIDHQADWIVSLGRKSATERICDLVWDLFDRMRASGRATNNVCRMPLTQYDIADVVGLTPVHVNRVLKTLRADGLVELQARRLRVPDPDALRRASGPPPRVEPRLQEAF